MTPQEVLLRAADLVERPNGWTQGEYSRWRGGPGSADESDYAYCTIGALRQAMARNTGHVDYAVLWAAVDLIKDATGVLDVYAWNDQIMTSGEDVAAWMRKAAKA